MRIKFTKIEMSRLSGLKWLSIAEVMVASLLVLSMTQGAWVASGIRESMLKAALERQIARVNTSSDIIFGGGIILMWAVLALDFFVYSVTGWLAHAVTPLIFTISAIFLRHGYPEKDD